MNKMKGECTKSSVKCLEIAKKILTLAKLSFTFNKVSETRHLCARTDSDVQEVESGSSTLMMTERGLSEFASCYGVDSSFIFSSSSGFARTLLSENVDDSPHRPFIPQAVRQHEKQHILNINFIIMKKSLALLFLMFFAITVYGQTDTVQSRSLPVGEKVFDVVEEQPSFPGGQGALISWLAENIKYPVEAAKAGIQGRVIVQFVVTATGSIADVKVVSGVEPSLDKEAVRVISSMPKWTPGKQNGTAVNVRYTYPVIFRLQ